MYGFPAPFMQPYAAGMLPALPENFGGLSSDLGMGSSGQGPNSGLFSPADLFSLRTAAALQRAEANLAVPPDLEMSLSRRRAGAVQRASAAEPTPRPAGYRLGGDERIELQKRVQRAAWSAFRPGVVPEASGRRSRRDWNCRPTSMPGKQRPGRKSAAWSAVAANPLEYDFRFGPYQYPARLPERRADRGHRSLRCRRRPSRGSGRASGTRSGVAAVGRLRSGAARSGCRHAAGGLSAGQDRHRTRIFPRSADGRQRSALRRPG